jgi:hypothetical protein
MTVLEYASPQDEPPRWRQTFYHARWALLVLYLALIAGGAIFWNWAGLDPFPLVICLLIFFALQALFLIGMPQLRWPRATKRTPMALSLAAGALAIAMLTFGLLGIVLNALDVWEGFMNRLELEVFWVLAIIWEVWLILFAAMWAGQQWFGGFKKLYKLLIAGTFLELLITIPIDVQVRKRTNCYCGEGTFFALVITSTLAIWSFGPGLVLLFLTRRLQRDGYFSLCGKCGYDLRGTAEKRCPKCAARVPEKYRSRAAVERA